MEMFNGLAFWAKSTVETMVFTYQIGLRCSLIFENLQNKKKQHFKIHQKYELGELASTLLNPECCLFRIVYLNAAIKFACLLVCSKP